MNSPIGRIGGKRALRKEIISRFPLDGVGRYIEVFFGAGWVFFGREKAPGQLEVINDKDGNIVNLFRCIKYHREALQQELEWLVTARETFFNAIAQLEAGGLTDIQRAARFYYRVRCSFGSDQKTFTTASKSAANTAFFTEVQQRLKGVIIENRDFEPILKTYDRPDALFYLDPPYLGAEQYYDGGFSWEDHLRLAASLRRQKGRFVLSYNDDPRIRTLYEDWCTVESLQRRDTLPGNTNSRKLYNEVIIKNY